MVCTVESPETIDEMGAFEQLVKDQKALEKSQQKLALKISSIEGILNAPKHTPHPYLTPLIAVGATMVFTFLGWIAYTLVDQGKSIVAIRQSIVGMGIKVAAANASSPEGQSQAKVAIEEAQKASIPVPASVVAEAGKSFIEASTSSPGAWDVALELAGYRSHLNFPGLAPYYANSGARTEGTWAFVHGLDGHRPESFMSQQSTTIDQAAIAEKLGEPANPTATTGPVFLVFKAGVIFLEDTNLRHVVFDNADIRYSGGPTVLNDVLFVNCTFLITDNDNGRGLVSKLVKSTRIDFDSRAMH